MLESFPRKSKRVRLLAGKNVFLSVFLRGSWMMRASDGSGTYRAGPDACISAKTWMVSYKLEQPCCRGFRAEILLIENAESVVA